MYKPLQSPALPDKQYVVIAADPPWSYNDKAHSGQRGVVYKYPTMSMQQLEELPVGSIAAKDSALFLWATAPQMPDAINLLSKWGFTYKTIAFTWVKLNRLSPGWHWGMGNWTRANAEFVILGIRGHPLRVDKGVHSVVDSPVQAHSQKPVEVRTRIERLLGDVPRIELFAREKPVGWDVWGLQRDGEDING